MAQRIEDVAKQVMTEDDEAVVLVSEAVLRSADMPFPAQPVGRHTLRGRQELTEIFRLL
jgi:adenylate cyclase